MNINLIYDPSANNAPVGFKTALGQVVQFLNSLFSANITVNIEVGWGTIGTSATPVSDWSAEGGPLGYTYTYAQLKTMMAGHISSADQATALASLGATDPTSGGSIFVTNAQLKAWGIAVGGTYDGEVGFGAGATQYTFDVNNRSASGKWDFFGVAMHEITHALGRFAYLTAPYYSVMDLFRYNGVGSRQLVDGQAAYFSPNGGTSNWGNFALTSDTGDLDASAGSDSFAAYSSGSPNNMGANDVRMMNVLGFGLNNFTVTGAVAAHAAPIPDNWIPVADSSANLSSGMANLLSLNTAGSLASVALTDAGGNVSITSGQFLTDLPVLSKITNSYGLFLTDSATAAISLTSAQLLADASYLSHLTSDANLVVSNSGAFTYTMPSSGHKTSIKVTGSGGAATIIGGSSADIIEVGTVSSTLTGGAGADVFVFTSSDLVGNATETLTDYTEGTDTIRLEGISASAVNFSGTAAAPTVLVTNASGTTTFKLNAQSGGSVSVYLSSSLTSNIGTLVAGTTANMTVITYNFNATGTAAQRVTKTYDAASYLLSNLTKYADGSALNLYYDATHNLIETQSVSAGGVVTSDIKTTYPISGGHIDTITGSNYGQYSYVKTYNASGNLIENLTSGFTGRPYSVVDDFFDTSGRITEEKQTTSGGVLYLDTKTTFNADGSVVNVYSGSSYGQLTVTETKAAAGYISERLTSGYTGLAYSSVDIFYDSLGRTTENKQTTAGGVVYYDGKTTYTANGYNIAQSGTLYGQFNYVTYYDNTGHVTENLTNGFTGRPYISVDDYFDASNRTIEEKQIAAGGVVYLDTKTTFNADGSITNTYSGSSYGQYTVAETKVVAGYISERLISGYTSLPYTSADLFYDASGRLTENKQTSGTGSVYYDAKTTYNANGTTTSSYSGSLYGQFSYTVTYDATGHQIESLASGYTGRAYTSVDDFFDASGRTIEEKMITSGGVVYLDTKTTFNADGSVINTYSGSSYGQYTVAETKTATGYISERLTSGYTGLPYTSADIFYDASGRVTENKQTAAGGAVYYDAKTVYNADGSTTVTYSGSLYAGDTHLVNNSAAGVQTSDLVTHADGSKTLNVFGNSQTVTSTGAARETLIGYGTGDLFVIHAGFTTEEISGVTAYSGGHPLQFDTSLFANYAAFIAASSDNGAGGVTATALNGSTIIVDNITKAQLAAL